MEQTNSAATTQDNAQAAGAQVDQEAVAGGSLAGQAGVGLAGVPGSGLAAQPATWNPAVGAAPSQQEFLLQQRAAIDSKDMQIQLLMDRLAQ